MTTPENLKELVIIEKKIVQEDHRKLIPQNSLHQVYGIIDIGKIRESQQDALAYLIFEDKKGQQVEYYIVTDGMGGMAQGGLAARNGTDKFLKEIKVGKEIRQALLSASGKVAGIRASGATLGGVKIAPGEKLGEYQIDFFNVGDVRGYLFDSGEETLELVTKDHSLAWEVWKAGEISFDKIRTHVYQSALSRGLGNEDLDVSDVVYRRSARSEDYLLICCDGLWETMPQEIIEEVIKNDQWSKNDDERDISTVEAKMKLLVELANQEGRDNISGILIKLV